MCVVVIKELLLRLSNVADIIFDFPQFIDTRERSDKYLVSPLDGTPIVFDFLTVKI